MQQGLGIASGYNSLNDFLRHVLLNICAFLRLNYVKVVQEELELSEFAYDVFRTDDRVQCLYVFAEVVACV